VTAGSLAGRGGAGGAHRRRGSHGGGARVGAETTEVWIRRRESIACRVGWVGSGDKSRTSVGTLKPTKIIFSFIGRIFNRRKLSYFRLAQTSQRKLCFFVVF
jgi:hypothetical protein